MKYTLFEDKHNKTLMAFISSRLNVTSVHRNAIIII